MFFFFCPAIRFYKLRKCCRHPSGFMTFSTLLSAVTAIGCAVRLEGWACVCVRLRLRYIHNLAFKELHVCGCAEPLYAKCRGSVAPTHPACLSVVMVPGLVPCLGPVNMDGEHRRIVPLPQAVSLPHSLSPSLQETEEGKKNEGEGLSCLPADVNGGHPPQSPL